MRLTSFFVKNSDPIINVSINALSDIVVIAGPNGVGKTRLIQALLNFFQNPTEASSVGMTLEATCEQEEALWKKKMLDAKLSNDCKLVRATLQKPQRRNQYQSSVLNFESDRSVRNIRPYQFTWDITDPLEEDVGWNLGLGFLRDRFQDVQDTIFRRVESQRRNISARALELKNAGATQMPLDFPDPLAPFKKAFFQLLGPKRLLDADPRHQQLFYEYEGNKLLLETLSSGEREVVSIVFDFIVRNPSNCIIIFDEPELHLHPELSYKLLQTLSTVGKSNQFIFCTHSPDIITASLEHSVIFLTPKKPDLTNQALLVNREDETHHALQLLGQSIGIVSLGKKLVLIEGEESSLDKQTYGSILRSRFPDLVLVPVGGKSTIRSFNDINQSVLNKTIWGVEFFMLCDRDALHALGPKSVSANLSPRLKLLPRYHLENYFLDETTLTRVFEEMEPADSWLRSPEQINEKLRRLALELVPYCVSLNVSAYAREKVGNIDIMPKDLSSSKEFDALAKKVRETAEQEIARVQGSLDLNYLVDLTKQEFDRLNQAIQTNDQSWRRDITGRVILSKFAGASKLPIGRLKLLYLKHADTDANNPFSEIIEIFSSFSSLPTTTSSI